MHGITKSITFPVKTTADDNSVTIDGTLTVKKEDFGMVYGKGIINNDVPVTSRLRLRSDHMQPKEAIGLGVLLPAVVAAVVLLPLRLRPGMGGTHGPVLGGLAIALGFFAGYIGLGFAPLKPDDAWNWLPWLWGLACRGRRGRDRSAVVACSTCAAGGCSIGGVAARAGLGVRRPMAARRPGAAGTHGLSGLVDRPPVAERRQSTLAVPAAAGH